MNVRIEEGGLRFRMELREFNSFLQVGRVELQLDFGIQPMTRLKFEVQLGEQF